MLRKQGYHVIEAGSAPEALSLLEDARQVDLLVTDLVLPDGTNGQQLAQEVVRHRPHTRLLFTFGKMQNGLPPEDLPGANVLAKPYRGRALVRKVHEILSQHVDARETDEGPAGTPVRPVAEA
jgi:CheY-like chemotaxis protein